MKKRWVYLFLALTISGCAQATELKQEGGDNTVRTVQVPKPEARGKFVVGKQYKVKGVSYKPRVDLRYRATGIASWYGQEFQGEQTANGARYDKRGYTAAHQTLPLPSVVRVTNLNNNKSLLVVVNDRGPFRKGRIIDVSKKAAEDLGFVTEGIANVRVEYLHSQTVALLAHYPRAEREKAAGYYRLAAVQQGLLTHSLN